MVAVAKAYSLVKNVISSMIGEIPRVCSNEVHILEAMNWLLRAQKITGNNGVSEGFHMYHGWLPAYPETTGYIIETFCHYAEITDNNHYRESAIKMADWLSSIQNDDGAILDSYFRKKMIFDTGQAIFGFVKIYEETGNIKYKNAAVKAADWIISQQEKDGSWIKYAVHNIPHAYYSRVAWSLLQVHQITSRDRYAEFCIKNIEWCLSRQQDNGWFGNASFNINNHHRPFTHTIAYTIRGILESGIYLQEKKYINAAQKALDNLALEIPSSGFVPGTFNKDWKGDTRFSCLTGNVQLSISFLKLAKLIQSEKYFKIGTVINGYVKSKQNIHTNNLNIRGAIAGSYPVWGNYIHFTYPNWAAKFFVDALLLEKNFLNNL
jgi:rhamnogalacturonyl hydrolase YesR